MTPLILPDPTGDDGMTEIVIDLGPIRVVRDGPHPLRSGLWRGRSRRLGLDALKLGHARSLGWDEHARGRQWLTWLPR